MEKRRGIRWIDEHTDTVILFHACRLHRTGLFRPADIEDLEQELRAAVLAARPRHDPGRGAWRTFVDRVVGNRAKNLVKEQRAERRNPRRCCYIADLKSRSSSRCHPDDGVFCEFDADAYGESFGRVGHSVERAEIRIDLSTIWAELEPQERTALARLFELTITELSREIGVPRTSLYRVMRRLRAVLRRRGLGL